MQLAPDMDSGSNNLCATAALSALEKVRSAPIPLHFIHIARTSEAQQKLSTNVQTILTAQLSNKFI